MASEPPRQNHLLIIEDNKGRREYTLDSPVYSIGRDPKCDIRLVSQFVSRRHATLVQLPNEDGTYYYRIVDGNLKGKPSANGLLINGRKLQAHDLQDEDKVVFGPQVEAIYYSLKRDAVSTIPPSEGDDFDITLISPNMVDEEDEDEDDYIDPITAQNLAKASPISSSLPLPVHEVPTQIPTAELADEGDENQDAAAAVEEKSPESGSTPTKPFPAQRNLTPTEVTPEGEDAKA